MTSVNEIFDSAPEDTWVTLHRTTGAHAGIDPQYSYTAEIGYKGDWRTGPLYAPTPESALTAAIQHARGILGLSPPVQAVVQSNDRSLEGRMWLDLCSELLQAKQDGDEHRQAFLHDLLARIELAYPKEIKAEQEFWLSDRAVTALHMVGNRPQLIVQVASIKSNPTYQLLWDWDQTCWVRLDPTSG